MTNFPWPSAYPAVALLTTALIVLYINKNHPPEKVRYGLLKLKNLPPPKLTKQHQILNPNQESKKNFGVGTSGKVECENGNNAHCYKYLVEISKNSPEEAGNYARDLCENGNAEVCGWIGSWYYFKKKKYEEALYFWDKACEEKDQQACFNAGALEWAGDEKNYHKMTNYFKTSCELGNSSGCNYAAGLLIEQFQNYELAQEMYDKSCDLSDNSICNHLAFNAHMQKNVIEARSYYEKSCKRDYPQGCTGIGVIEFNEGNINKAKNIFSETCNQKDYSACQFLGIIYEQENNIERAVQLYKLACSHDIKDACTLINNRI